MGADEGAFGGIERSFEEGAEDGGLDVRPVVLGGVEEDAEVGEDERDGGVVGEEATVEVLDFIRAEEAALIAHGGEEGGEDFVEIDGGEAVIGDELAEGVVGKELDRIGEEAEDEAHEEVRDLLFCEG